MILVKPRNAGTLPEHLRPLLQVARSRSRTGHGWSQIVIESFEGADQLREWALKVARKRDTAQLRQRVCLHAVTGPVTQHRDNADTRCCVIPLKVGLSTALSVQRADGLWDSVPLRVGRAYIFSDFERHRLDNHARGRVEFLTVSNR